MEEIPEVSDSTFDDEVIEQDKFLKLVYFYFPWMPICRENLDILSEFMDEYKNKVQFFKINVDKSPRISSRYSIRNEPTIIIFHKGEEFGKIGGEINEVEVKAEIDSLLLELKHIKKDLKIEMMKIKKKDEKNVKKKNNNRRKLENESKLRRRNKTRNRNKK